VSLIVSFLYWYSYFNSNRNIIVGSAAALITTIFIEALSSFLIVIKPEVFHTFYFKIIPKFIFILGLLNIMRCSLKDTGDKK